MSRLEPIPPAELNDEQKRLYERITTGPRARGAKHFRLTRGDGALIGPFNALLLSPGVGEALQEVGAAVRYRTGLAPRTRELAILLVAAHWDSSFERSSHESVGRAVGVTDEEIATIRSGGIPQLSDPRESACVQLVKAMLDGDVDDETWDQSATAVDNAIVFELSSLVGYYSTLALQMRVFRVG